MSSPATAAPEQSAGLPLEELETLLAPIALYPDVLLAQILPASTFPVDIVLAARWLRTNPDMSTLLEQKWDPSVLALCNYPEVIYMLDKDLDWTNAVGTAFLSQQPDVMNAIQELRRKAEVSGALRSTAQQAVVSDEGYIRIVPTQEDTVYVPQYDPQAVYAPEPAETETAISFGAGLPLGAWLNTDCDWPYGGVVWCQPGYWGGWRYAGAVHWNAGGWAAFGPHGAAVRGDHGRGAAWTRRTPYGTPAYTGRYASYGAQGNRNAQINRGPGVADNQVNVHRTAAIVDRGYGTDFQGGNLANTQGRDRTNMPAGGGMADRGTTYSAFGGEVRSSEARQYSQRGSGIRSQTGADARPSQATGLQPAGQSWYSWPVGANARSPQATALQPADGSWYSWPAGTNARPSQATGLQPEERSWYSLPPIAANVRPSQAIGLPLDSARISSFNDRSSRQQTQAASNRGAASLGGGASHAGSGIKSGGGMNGGGGIGRGGSARGSGRR
jgi:hypothetical protein